MNNNVVNFIEPKGKKSYLFEADLDGTILSIMGVDLKATLFTFDKLDTQPETICHYSIICKPIKDLVLYINERYNDKNPFSLLIVNKSKNINVLFQKCFVENYFQPVTLCSEDYKLSFLTKNE